MPPGPLTISRLLSGGLITTYRCPSRCRHCLYRSGPRWPRDYISRAEALESLHTVRRLGCRSVHIGGGEPFLDPQGLIGVLGATREAGVRVEYVETNSSWYRDHARACRLLERLAGSGVSALLVSVSPFHNEHIPFVKVQGVIRACREVGITVLPWVWEFAGEIGRLDPTRPHPLEEYETAYGPGYLQRLPSRYWISPGGRALETFGRFGPARPVEQIAAEGAGGCAELARTDHFHLDLYGNYVPGLCAGLSVRREDLGAPLDPERYPILTALHTGGVRALMDLAASRHGYRPGRDGYPSKCALCFEVRRFLVVERGVASPELRPEGHYRYG